MKKRQSLFIILWMVGASVYAQESINYNQQDYEVTITKTIEKILLDGNLNEGIWKTNTSFPAASISRRASFTQSVVFPNMLATTTGRSFFSR